MDDNKEVTISSIRDELRNAIFCASFYSTAHKINMEDIQQQALLQKAHGFVEFGVRSGLFTPEEGNDWLAGIWRKRPIAEVCDKYMKDTEKRT